MGNRSLKNQEDRFLIRDIIPVNLEIWKLENEGVLCWWILFFSVFFIFYLFIFLEVQSVAESEVILGGREDWREGRHGCIECQFEFGNYKLIITLKCSFAIFCPVMLSCTSAGLEKTHTWIHPGLEFCQLV